MRPDCKEAPLGESLIHEKSSLMSQVDVKQLDWGDETGTGIGFGRGGQRSPHHIANSFFSGMS